MNRYSIARPAERRGGEAAGPGAGIDAMRVAVQRARAAAEDYRFAEPSGMPEFRKTGMPVIQYSGKLESRKTEIPECRITGMPECRKTGIGAAVVGGNGS